LSVEIVDEGAETGDRGGDERVIELCLRPYDERSSRSVGFVIRPALLEVERRKAMVMIIL
jgi:hypothetical protein